MSDKLLFQLHANRNPLMQPTQEMIAMHESLEAEVLRAFGPMNYRWLTPADLITMKEYPLDYIKEVQNLDEGTALATVTRLRASKVEQILARLTSSTLAHVMRQAKGDVRGDIARAFGNVEEPLKTQLRLTLSAVARQSPSLIVPYITKTTMLLFDQAGVLDSALNTASSTRVTQILQSLPDGELSANAAHAILKHVSDNIQGVTQIEGTLHIVMDMAAKYDKDKLRLIASEVCTRVPAPYDVLAAMTVPIDCSLVGELVKVLNKRKQAASYAAGTWKSPKNALCFIRASGEPIKLMTDVKDPHIWKQLLEDICSTLISWTPTVLSRQKELVQLNDEYGKRHLEKDLYIKALTSLDDKRLLAAYNVLQARMPQEAVDHLKKQKEKAEPGKGAEMLASKGTAKKLLAEDMYKMYKQFTKEGFEAMLDDDQYIYAYHALLYNALQRGGIKPTPRMDELQKISDMLIAEHLQLDKVKNAFNDSKVTWDLIMAFSALRVFIGPDVEEQLRAALEMAAHHHLATQGKERARSYIGDGIRSFTSRRVGFGVDMVNSTALTVFKAGQPPVPGMSPAGAAGAAWKGLKAWASTPAVPPAAVADAARKGADMVNSTAFTVAQTPVPGVSPARVAGAAFKGLKELAGTAAPCAQGRCWSWRCWSPCCWCCIQRFERIG